MTKSSEPVLIIAEAGVNHNGDRNRALQLVNAAVDARADIIKFQTFEAKSLLRSSAPKAAYQIEATGKQESQFEMISNLALDHEDHIEIANYCSTKGIEFMSTPFDIPSLAFLVKHLDAKRLKIASGDLTHGPLLYNAALTGLPIILSTGMATLDEVKDAIGLLALAWIENRPPEKEEDLGHWAEIARQDAITKDRLTLLHCTSAYPTPVSDVNLSAMDTLRVETNLTVGYSDHTIGITVPIGAVACGARVVEKHFTLDRTLPGPDHQASLEPQELNAMVQAVRDMEKAFGTGEKAPMEIEKNTAFVARRSIVAGESGLKQGEAITTENVEFKRPADGFPPTEIWRLLGMKARDDIKADETLTLDKLI
jgi:N-acetylneuraminate synthase